MGGLPLSYIYIYIYIYISAGPPGATRLWRIMHIWLSTCLQVYSLMYDVFKSACKLVDNWIVGPRSDIFTLNWPCDLSPGIPAICSKYCVYSIYVVFVAYAAPVQQNTTPVQPNTTAVQPNATPVQPSTTPVQPNTTRVQPNTTLVQ